jgi:hypothetical protein
VHGDSDEDKEILRNVYFDSELVLLVTRENSVTFSHCEISISSTIRLNFINVMGFVMQCAYVIHRYCIRLLIFVLLGYKEVKLQ